MADTVQLVDGTIDPPRPIGVPLRPVLWAANTPMDFTLFGSCEIQVTGTSGGGTISMSRSVDGATYYPVNYVDQAFALGSVIAADGVFSYPGGAWMKFAKTAGTAVVTVRGDAS